MSLSEQTIRIIKSTAPVLAEQGDAITRHFYQQMSNHNPELMNVFSISNQQTDRQQVALADAIQCYAAYIDNPPALKDAVERFAQKHASFTLQPEQYSIVGKYLLEAAAYVLKDKATDKILDAWREAYQMLANLFIETEEGVYRQCDSTDGSWQGTREFRVAARVAENELITSFYFEPVDGRPVVNFLPGQHIGLSLKPENSGYRCIRQYSLSDAPNGKTYRISVKRETDCEKEGLISNYLHDSVQVGDIVELCPPTGEFVLDVEASSPVVLLSGGVGQTPIMSMLNTLAQTNRQVRYVHSAQNSKVHAFGAHTKTVADEHDNVEQIVFYNAPTADCSGHDYNGIMNMEAIRNRIELPNAHYYFCGPLGFMAMVNRTLKSWGVPKENIHFEVFGPHKEI
ncbi:NO-inducible flavohemoprotein [Endozoicomonadaceae bacterium StTr2]